MDNCSLYSIIVINNNLNNSFDAFTIDLKKYSNNPNITSIRIHALNYTGVMLSFRFGINGRNMIDIRLFA
jgi:hypothetical protein